MPPLLRLAARAAMIDADKMRRACLGAIGVRRDGAIVSTRNLSSKCPSPSSHAEARCLKMCDRGATIYVARVNRAGEMAMSRPCSRCMAAMRARKIARVVFSISEIEWGTITP